MNYDVPRLLALLEIDAKRNGREYHAKCPIHSDRNPSWQMAENSGLWHCWSCGEGGNAITLAAKVLRIENGAAREWLKINGISTETASVVPSSLPITVGGGFLGKPRFAGMQGRDIPLIWTAKAYLMTRGIDPSQSKKWNLSYGIKDDLENRIVFPIHDRQGNLQSFMARTTIGARPRYTTPHPSTNPDRDVIFGELYWPKDESESQIVVPEGAINALACERAGARYIAALGGSNPGLTVYAKLAKFGHVIIASDPDKAGERVASALKVLQRWTHVTRVVIPDGLDAADLSTEALRSRLIDAGMHQ